MKFIYNSKLTSCMTERPYEQAKYEIAYVNTIAGYNKVCSMDRKNF